MRIKHTSPCSENVIAKYKIINSTFRKNLKYFHIFWDFQIESSKIGNTRILLSRNINSSIKTSINSNIRRNLLQNIFISDQSKKEVKLDMKIVYPGKHVIGINLIHKKYPYMKIRKEKFLIKESPPKHGKCLVSPSCGFSLDTTFVFKTSHWVAFSTLKYNFVFFNQEINSYVNLGEGFSLDDTFTSNNIPPGDSFYVSVKDACGNTSMAKCILKVHTTVVDTNKAGNLLNQSTLPSKQMQVITALLGNMSLNSNKVVVPNPNTVNNKIGKNTINTANSNSGNIGLNKDELCSDSINATIVPNFTRTRLRNLSNLSIRNLQEENTNITDLIIGTQSSIIKEVGAFSNSFSVIGQIDQISIINKKTSSTNSNSLGSVFNNMNIISNSLIAKKKKSKINTPTPSDEEQLDNSVYSSLDNFTNSIEESMTKNIDSVMSNMNTKMQQSLIIGQTKTIIKENVEQNNSKLDSLGKLLKDKTLETPNTTDKTFGISEKFISAKKLLPINQEEAFSLNQFELNLKDGENSITSGIQNLSDLSMPNLKDPNVISKIQDTACIQYSEVGRKSNSVDCTTWFNQETNEVECDCGSTGLISNTLNKKLAALNKIKQFETNPETIFNIYSSTILIIMTGLFIVLIIIAIIKDDSKVSKLDLYIKHEAHDFLQMLIKQNAIEINQQRIANYTKNEKIAYDTYKIFISNVKILHPLYSIGHIFSPVYNRKLRVIDLLIQIYLKIFVTFLPLYFTENSEMEKVKTNRSIKDRHKSPSSLEVVAEQIIRSAIYTVCGNIVSALIIILLNFIYEDNTSKRYCTENLEEINRFIKERKKLNIYPNNFVKVRYKLIVVNTFINMYKNLQREKVYNENRHVPINNISSVAFADNRHNEDAVNNNLLKPNNTNIKLVSVTSSNNRNQNNNLMFNQKSQYPSIIIPNNNINNIVDNSSRTIIDQAPRNTKNRSAIANTNTKKQLDSIYEIKRKPKQTLPKTQITWINKKSQIKGILGSTIILVIIVLTMFMTADIYTKYQNKMMSLCIIPVISLIVLNMVVTANIMIFISTILMVLYGKTFYYYRKKNELLTIGYFMIVNPVAVLNHKLYLGMEELRVFVNNGYFN